MTTFNQQFCAGLVNAIRPDVEKAGFKNVQQEKLTLGICSIYIGNK